MSVGGNTSCVEVRTEERLVIFDAGTGLRILGEQLLAETPIRAVLFFSHVHWDHIQGFPFFQPAFVAGNHFDLYGGRDLTATLAETLAGQMNFPNFPVTLEQMGATMIFHEFSNGQLINLGGGVSVRALSLNHPNGCYGYRVECGGKVVAYCTDTEHGNGLNANVVALAADSDLFIYDAQYTPEEYAGKAGGFPRIGWGHSTFEKGAELAHATRAKRLILFHHDPAHDDAAILEIERRCRALFPAAEAAREGLACDL